MVTQNGQQLGPFTLNEVNAALAGGELSPDDLAWHAGAPGWIMLSAVAGVVTPRSTRSMPLPPPVRSVSVADELEDGQISSQAFGYAYSIIVAVGIIAEIVLHAASQGKVSLPWWVYLGAYAGIYAWEKKQLSDPSLLPSGAWLLFVPAYLYKRAKAFRQPMGSFWTFNALLVLSIFIAVAQDDTLTRGARSSPSGDQGSATQQAPAPSATAEAQQQKNAVIVRKILALAVSAGASSAKSIREAENIVWANLEKARLLEAEYVGPGYEGFHDDVTKLFVARKDFATWQVHYSDWLGLSIRGAPGSEKGLKDAGEKYGVYGDRLEEKTKVMKSKYLGEN